MDQPFTSPYARWFGEITFYEFKSFIGFLSYVFEGSYNLQILRLIYFTDKS